MARGIGYGLAPEALLPERRRGSALATDFLGFHVAEENPVAPIRETGDGLNASAKRAASQAHRRLSAMIGD